MHNDVSTQLILAGAGIVKMDQGTRIDFIFLDDQTFTNLHSNTR